MTGVWVCFCLHNMAEAAAMSSSCSINWQHTLASQSIRLMRILPQDGASGR